MVSFQAITKGGGTNNKVKKFGRTQNQKTIYRQRCQRWDQIRTKNPRNRTNLLFPPKKDSQFQYTWEGERQKDWSCPLLSKITKKNYYRCFQIAIPFSLLSSLSLFIFFEKENVFLICLRSWDNGRTWYVIKKTDYATRMSVRRDLSFLFSLRLILINCLKSAN